MGLWHTIGDAVIWRRRFGVLLTATVAAVGLGYMMWPWWSPSVDAVVEATAFDLDDDAVQYEGRRFRLTTEGEVEELEGTLQQIKRVHEPRFPILTHDAVLVDGDFAAPDRVTISSLRRHNASWRAQFKPRGQFLVARLIPGSIEVARALEDLEAGEPTRLRGRRLKGEVLDGEQVVWGLCNTFVVSGVEQGDDEEQE